MMTDDELRAIEERANRATEGPWHRAKTGLDGDEERSVVCYRADSDDGLYYIATVHTWRSAAPDATFIAAARTDVPTLIAEVRRLQQENLELRIDRADLDTGHAEAHAEADRLRAVLEGMVRAYAYRGHRGVEPTLLAAHHGPLKDAFNALGWDDPHVMEPAP